MSMIALLRDRLARPSDCGRSGQDKLLIEIVPRPYFRWKRFVDCFLAALLLIPCLPVMGLLVLLVRLTSRGPGIFRQARVGKGGRTFTMYKIRSMVHDAEALTGAAWAQPDDPRVTTLGRFLRIFHLDELPQLFNVLKGEMSLVGPRPERPEFVSVLVQKIPGYANRLAVAPGITGLAQLKLPPDSDLESVRRKLALDLQYILKAGPIYDLWLLVYTFLRLANVFEKLAIWRFFADARASGPARNGSLSRAWVSCHSCTAADFETAAEQSGPPVSLQAATSIEASRIAQ